VVIPLVVCLERLETAGDGMGGKGLELGFPGPCTKTSFFFVAAGAGSEETAAVPNATTANARATRSGKRLCFITRRLAFADHRTLPEPWGLFKGNAAGVASPGSAPGNLVCPDTLVETTVPTFADTYSSEIGMDYDLRVGHAVGCSLVLAGH